jgi:hypothetical protein
VAVNELVARKRIPRLVTAADELAAAGVGPDEHADVSFAGSRQDEIRIPVPVHVGDDDAENGAGELEVLGRFAAREPDDQLAGSTPGLDPVLYAVAVDVGGEGLRGGRARDQQ